MIGDYASSPFALVIAIAPLIWALATPLRSSPKWMILILSSTFLGLHLPLFYLSMATYSSSPLLDLSAYWILWDSLIQSETAFLLFILALVPLHLSPWVALRAAYRFHSPSSTTRT